MSTPVWCEIPAYEVPTGATIEARGPNNMRVLDMDLTVDNVRKLANIVGLTTSPKEEHFGYTPLHQFLKLLRLMEVTFDQDTPPSDPKSVTIPVNGKNVVFYFTQVGNLSSINIE